MTDLKEIREEAFKLAEKPYISGNPTYTKCSPIYLAPNENIKESISLTKHAKKVLTVDGMGAFGFESILNGAKKVDFFDINELQILFSKMALTAIAHLSYEDFIKHFTLPKQEAKMPISVLKNLLSDEMYFKIEKYLPEEVKFVFAPLYDYFDSKKLILSRLYRFEHIVTQEFLQRYVSFYNEKEYKKLQDILKNSECEINFHCLSLTDLPKLLNTKYDAIVLGNILQYYKQIRALDTPYKVNLFIQRNLSNLLNPEGIIEVNYGFEIATNAFKKHYKMPYEIYGNTDFTRFITEISLDEEIIDGINVPLYSNWDHYSYHFINGVEQYEQRNSENLILTYQKK